MSYLRRVKFLNSITVTLALAIGLIVIAILSSMGWLIYSATDKVIEENSQDASNKIIQQVNYDIEYYLKAVETTIDSIKFSDIAADYFNDPEGESEEKAIQYLSSLVVNREDIINIALIHPNGNIITNDAIGVIKKDVIFTEEAYYTEAVKDPGMKVSGSHVQNIILGQYQWVVSCSSRYQLDADGIVDGVILVDLNYNLIEDMVSRIALGDRGYIFIIDDQGELVYHPKSELIYSGIRTDALSSISEKGEGILRSEVDGELVDYIISLSDYSRWKVIGKVYVNDINVYRETLRSYYVTMVMVAFVIAIILSVILAGSILRPVKRLLKGMSTFQSGQLDVEVHVESENELGILTATFNNMTKRIKTLVEENKQSERNKRKSELDALQAQINPHFLYNTLDSIVWMGEAGKNQEVVKMTSSLAKLFRISINKGKEYITLGQEIEHVESYLVIQQMRYGDKLSYDIEVEQDLLNTRIIKILLQPIIENAIYHGIKTLPGKGHIHIRGYKKEGHIVGETSLLIEVEDNGMGMEEETVHKLLRGDINPEAKGSGVGVVNVDQRIKLYYGDKYGLEIESEPFEGTIIRLVLPLMEGDYNEKV